MLSKASLFPRQPSFFLSFFDQSERYAKIAIVAVSFELAMKDSESFTEVPLFSYLLRHTHHYKRKLFISDVSWLVWLGREIA